ncbi:MAG: DUF952 domain-containing protein [Mariniblastus sp.]
MTTVNQSSNQVIYKIVDADQWALAKEQGEFAGAAIDLEDGYIHFSNAQQVKETVSKHFAGQSNLLIVTVDPEKLGDALKWEASRGGDLFPHLYGNLSFDCVQSVDDLPIGKNGEHLFPGAL